MFRSLVSRVKPNSVVERKFGYVRKMSSEVLKEIFLKSVEAVQPGKLIRDEVKLVGSHLSIRNASYPLRKPCYVVGFGKAVLGMALEVEKILGDRLQMGIVTVPDGITRKFRTDGSRIKFIEGAKDNIPDRRALDGAVQIKRLAEGLAEDDLLLVLISGGGSALLPLPKPPITLEEKQQLIRELTGRGADILELNCVRKRISAVKGGGLAEAAHPATVISLILSDVVGDPLDFIASGPTAPDTDGAEAAVKVIKKYASYDRLPASIKGVLERQEPIDRGLIVDGEYKHVRNFVVGNNSVAAEAARRHAASLGLQAAVLSTTVTGDVARLGRVYAEIARGICAGREDAELCLRRLEGELGISPAAIEAIIGFDFSRGLCLIAAGEPTVVVSGGGRGGRNQQLALAFSVELNKLNIKSADISFLSAGTDGMDGPTDAAGAIGTPDLVNNSRAENINPQDYLDNSDSYGFYSRFRGGSQLVRTGHTGTNVMDVHLLVVCDPDEM